MRMNSRGLWIGCVIGSTGILAISYAWQRSWTAAILGLITGLAWLLVALIRKPGQHPHSDPGWLASLWYGTVVLLALGWIFSGGIWPVSLFAIGFGLAAWDLDAFHRRVFGQRGERSTLLRAYHPAGNFIHTPVADRGEAQAGHADRFAHSRDLEVNSTAAPALSSLPSQVDPTVAPGLSHQPSQDDSAIAPGLINHPSQDNPASAPQQPTPQQAEVHAFEHTHMRALAWVSLVGGGLAVLGYLATLFIRVPFDINLGLGIGLLLLIALVVLARLVARS